MYEPTAAHTDLEDSDYIVLDNLPSNAWKFTARRVTARIAFGAAPHGSVTQRK
jgi:hypothetical protein